jgi:hypothetical protein
MATAITAQATRTGDEATVTVTFSHPKLATLMPFEHLVALVEMELSTVVENTTEWEQDDIESNGTEWTEDGQPTDETEAIFYYSR